MLSRSTYQALKFECHTEDTLQDENFKGDESQLQPPFHHETHVRSMLLLLLVAHHDAAEEDEVDECGDTQPDIGHRWTQMALQPGLDHGHKGEAEQHDSDADFEEMQSSRHEERKDDGQGRAEHWTDLQEHH